MPGAESGHIPRLGLVVHPTRDVGKALADLQSWSQDHRVEVVQIAVMGAQQEVAEQGDAAECELIVAVGGDGTTLAAVHGASPFQIPVLGVACGSLGALTSVPADGIVEALERFRSGDWEPQQLPAISLDTGLQTLNAFNDVAVVRAGEGQVRAVVTVDQVLYARLAGDGCIISTPVGSSAYSFAAGGPLIAAGTEAFLVTPLSNHGGSCPPLVVSSRARVELEVSAALNGVRLEVDGRIVPVDLEALRAQLQPGAATLVTFSDQEAGLSGLRRRGIVIDSPRILAEDERRRQHAGT